MKKLLTSTLLVSSFAVAGWANAGTLVVGAEADAGARVYFTGHGTAMSDTAGNFKGSTLDGKSLAMAYCLDAFAQINFEGVYSSNVYEDSGLNANEHSIAYLINNVTTANKTEEGALQAVIWELVHGNNFEFSTSLNSVEMVNAYDSFWSLATANSGYAGNVLWMYNSDSNGGYAQPFVGRFATAATPVPAAVWLFGSGLAGLIASRRKKSVLTA